MKNMAQEDIVEKKKYLTFELDEIFALEMTRVKEIIQYKPITKVPEAPAYIEGVINLRGTILPVINMRARLRKEDRSDLERRCIVIVSLEGEEDLGLLVDDMADIIEIPVDKIVPPPQVGSNYAHVFVKEIGLLDEEVIQIIDGDKLIHLEELAAVEAATQEQID